MRFASFEAYEINAWKIFAVASAGALAAGWAVWYVTWGTLGAASPEISVGLSAAVLYLIVTAPRRILAADRIAQSREALALSVSSIACLEVTRSKSRTLLLLRGRNRRIVEALERARRLVLLGADPADAVRASAKGLASDSALAAIQEATSTLPGLPDTSGEETRGYERAAEGELETRLPLLMTVCFFAPLMLVLYAVFARIFDAWGLAELVGLEFIAVDLGFFFASAEGRLP